MFLFVLWLWMVSLALSPQKHPCAEFRESVWLVRPHEGAEVWEGEQGSHLTALHITLGLHPKVSEVY